MTDVVAVALIAAVPQVVTASIWGFVNLRQSRRNHDAINGKVSKLMELQDEKMQEKVVNAVMTGYEGGKHQASEKRRQPDEPQPAPVNDKEPKE